MALAELEKPYLLDATVVDRFRADGFVRLPNVLSAEVLAEIGPDIDNLVQQRNKLADVPLEERTLYHQAFIQVCNLWRDSKRPCVNWHLASGSLGLPPSCWASAACGCGTTKRSTRSPPAV